MFKRRRLPTDTGYRVIAAILACLTCIAAKPTTKPAEPDRVDPLVLSAITAAEQGDLKPVADEAEKRVKELLARPEIDPAEATTVATVYEFGRFFGRLQGFSEANKKLLAWLIAQPQLSQTLMMAVSPEDPPDGVLAALRALHDEHGDQLAGQPDLTAAFCVVWDATGDVAEDSTAKVDLPRVARLYRYYTTARPMRIPANDLPWQLATWVVANPLSDQEVAFARGRYGVATAAGAYFDPPYGGANYVAKVERDGEVLLTLQNILKHSAGLNERAYYGVNVARTFGVPAGQCRGQRADTEEGPRPAWVAVLEPAGRRVRWNLDAVRYPEHIGWRSAVADPQTFTDLTDAELLQLAELYTTPAEKRLASIAVCKLADTAEPARRADLLLKAVDLSPGNIRAWRTLAELAGKRQLSPAHADAYTAAIERHLAKPNGLLAFDAYRPLVTIRGAVQQLELLDRPAKWFADRPELLARVRLEQGVVLVALQKPDHAVAAFRDAIARNPRNGPLVLAALERADGLFRQKNALGPLIALYADAWAALPRPKPSPYARSTPWVQIGYKYAQALDDAGRGNEARKVRSMSDSVYTSR